MDGILLINKEKGPTSFGAIEQVKRKFKLSKIGHSGTLDPLATGLLMVLIGKATKISDYLPSDKEYEMEVTFGRATNTDDAEGESIKELPVPDRLGEKIRSILPEFTGEITQVPPKFSAIKKDGQKLYDLARSGQEVNPEPRQVIVHSIELLSCTGDKSQLRVLCSSGTYMRSIARDMGEKLGSCAYLSALVRTKIGAFTLAQSHKTSELDTLEGKLVTMREGLYVMPEITLSQENYGRVKNGMTIDNATINKAGYVKMVYENELTAIGQIKYGKVYVKRGI
jgi:tRNA pseudouridine55 synthase